MGCTAVGAGFHSAIRVLNFSWFFVSLNPQRLSGSQLFLQGESGFGDAALALAVRLAPSTPTSESIVQRGWRLVDGHAGAHGAGHEFGYQTPCRATLSQVPH
jgi:hypothetical protein